MKYSKSLMSLLWVVFTDSLGWGIAFSVFAALFFNENSKLLPPTLSDTSRYFIYEFLLGIYSVFMFFCAPVIGGIADRYGRKPALNISMLGLTCGFILSALGCLWNSLSLLILGRIISGMTAGSLSVAQAAIVDTSTPQTKSFYLSMLVLVNCLGFSVGPILGGLLVNHSIGPIGMTTFLLAAVMSTLGLLSILLFFKEIYLPNRTEENKLNVLKDFLNIKIAFSKPSISYYLLSFLFSMVAYGLLFSNIPVFLHRQFSSNSSVTGFVLSGFVIVLSTSLMLGGKYIFNYFEKEKIVFIAQSIQLITYIILALLIHSFIVNCLLFACIAFTVGLMYVGLLTLISDATEKDWQGRVMGVIASLFSLTWGIGPILAGELNKSAVSASFICSGTLVGLAIIAMLFRSSLLKHIKFKSDSL